MMAAHRLKGLGWFGTCAGIVLAFYLVSLQVANERNKLGALNDRIRSAERDIRALETEFDTRANLQQLERWNGDILALSAPVAGQFLGGGAQLASVSFYAPLTPTTGEGEVRTAALVVPSMPVIEPTPMQVAAVQVQSTPVQVTEAVVRAPVQVAQAVVRTPAPAVVVRASAPAAAPRPSVARMQRVAMLDGDLLTDLSSAARIEALRR